MTILSAFVTWDGFGAFLSVSAKIQKKNPASDEAESGRKISLSLSRCPGEKRDLRPYAFAACSDSFAKKNVDKLKSGIIITLNFFKQPVLFQFVLTYRSREDV